MSSLLSRGAVMLRAWAGTNDAIAAACGVSYVTAASWRSGRRKPGADGPRLILAAPPFNIPVETWEQAAPVGGGALEQLQRAAMNPPAVPAMTPGELAEVKATPQAVRSLADTLMREALQLQQQMSTLPEDAMTRTTFLDKLSNILLRLGKFTGEGLELSERQILQSPHAARIEDAILGALEEWPDAMRAVADALEALHNVE